LSDFTDWHVILTRIVSQIWICFWNQNQTTIVQTVTILMCVIEFLRQNLAGLMTHPVIVLAGGRIFTAFLMKYKKTLYLWPWQKWPRTGGYLKKNLNYIKARGHLVNIKISVYSQDKCRELLSFSKYLALLCFEMLGIENPRSDLTKGRRRRG
jgi:hypothetical protein